MVFIKLPGKLPTRLTIGLMIFTCTFVSYVIRVNMSISIIAMVESKKSDNNETTVAECTAINNPHNNSTVTHEKNTDLNFGPRYDWDNKIQGYILSSFFWGYTISNLPGGYLAEKFGSRKVVFFSTLIPTIATAITPLLASWSFYLVILARFIAGLGGGFIYPGLHHLIAHWSPPAEKGKFSSALMGSSLGTVITWPALGIIIESLGWNYSFYIPSVCVGIWCFVWYFFVTDSPETHPRISEDEKIYIVKSLGDSISSGKHVPPYKAILTSVPFWALVVLQFGSLWGLFFIMTAGPTFLSTVLGFNLGHTGVLASLPYLARMVFGFIFGFIADIILKRKWLSRTALRKSFVIFSHILPAVFLMLQTLTGCDVTWAIVLLTLSLGVNGASVVTNLQNNQDLAPNYAATLYGIATCFGGTSGFISPIIVGNITAEKNGMAEWHLIFYIGAAVYISSGLFFIVFGSGEEQPWNVLKPNDKRPETPKNGEINNAFEGEIAYQGTNNSVATIIENATESRT